MSKALLLGFTSTFGMLWMPYTCVACVMIDAEGAVCNHDLCTSESWVATSSLSMSLLGSSCLLYMLGQQRNAAENR